MCDAPVGEVESAIAPSTWPEQKAPRIQQVLQQITERLNGNLSLEFLENTSLPEARAWLESLPGVGPKTSASVLLFSRLRKPALSVDSHHHRVASRLGLIPGKSAGRSGARHPRGAIASRLGRAESLGQPRSAHAPRSEVLLFPPSRMRTLCDPGLMSIRSEAHRKKSRQNDSEIALTSDER